MYSPRTWTGSGGVKLGHVLRCSRSISKVEIWRYEGSFFVVLILIRRLCTLRCARLHWYTAQVDSAGQFPG